MTGVLAGSNSHLLSGAAAEFEIEIVNAQRERIGTLVPIGRPILENPHLIELLTAWRNQNRGFFLTQFEPTVSRTRRWLEEMIPAVASKLLFLIYEQNGIPVGHLGVKQLGQPVAELDNMIRGLPGGGGQFMFWAEIALLRWLFEEKKVYAVCLRVLTNNWIPINIHREIGFRVTETSCLWKQEMDGEIELVTSPGTGEIQGEIQKAKLARMELTAEEFARFAAGRLHRE